jgi:hypothetical protein
VLLELLAPSTLVAQSRATILKIVRAILRADAALSVSPRVGSIVEVDGEG